MKRSNTPELMDDFSIQDERIEKALKELKVINCYLGGISTSRAGLKYICKDYNRVLSIADVGSGSSDVLSTPKLHFNRLKIISLDKNITCLRLTDNIDYLINSDAFQLPLKDNSVDIIHVSLFLHHFDEEQILKLIKEFKRICSRGIIINDLRRSYLAYLGIKVLTSLFSNSEFVKHDAPLSVKRGFKRSEIINIIRGANGSHAILKRKWAFRWLVVIKK